VYKIQQCFVYFPLHVFRQQSVTQHFLCRMMKDGRQLNFGSIFFLVRSFPLIVSSQHILKHSTFSKDLMAQGAYRK